MGQMRFQVPQPSRLDDWAVDSAYLAGMEGVPWKSSVSWNRPLLTFDRMFSESGNLFIPWEVPGHGTMMLSTASLMERVEPYDLPIELTRGTLNRVRNQAAEWQQSGLDFSTQFQQRLRDATTAFSHLVTGRLSAADAAGRVDQAIIKALEAGEQLSAEYAEQMLAIRHRQQPRLNTLLTGNLGPVAPPAALTKPFLAAFNTAAIPFNWRDVQPNDGEFEWETSDQQVRWCNENELNLCGGPLLQLDAATLPDWLYLWEDDFENLEPYVLQFAEAVVRRYRGKIQLWHCAARVNRTGSLAISEEDRLRLTVRTIETVRRKDPQTPVFVSFDQPWGEYLAKEDLDLAPLHFADALVRADLGIAGIGLELNLGYWPGGSLPRDPLQISRQLDRWSYLGLPLLILLSLPSGDRGDSQARRSTRTLAAAGSGQPTPASQQEAVARLLPMLLAKPAVQGVAWNQLGDAQPHEFPHGGIFDADDQPKPLLQTFTELRSQHLA